jgi:hypothetical protein
MRSLLTRTIQGFSCGRTMLRCHCCPAVKFAVFAQYITVVMGISVNANGERNHQLWGRRDERERNGDNPDGVIATPTRNLYGRGRLKW